MAVAEAPRMVVIAGPPGSGKSSLFRPTIPIDYFNTDERARELNAGSGHNTSPEIRATVNRELEAFIREHIVQRNSFAYETTLRTTITYDQAREAKNQGFLSTMYYVSVDTVEESINRVRIRSESGGHSAPPERLREIYTASMKNFPRALEEFDHVLVWDNSSSTDRPVLHLETVYAQAVYISQHTPGWLNAALIGSAHEITEDLRRRALTLREKHSESMGFGI